MRITFDKNIRTMSGKCKNGNMVFMSMKNDTICIGRTYVYPKLNDQHEAAGGKLKAATQIWKTLPSPFKNELIAYAKAYNSQVLSARKLPVSAFNVFIMAVCKQEEKMNSIEEISVALGNTIAEWITKGHLKAVSVINPFTATLT